MRAVTASLAALLFWLIAPFAAQFFREQQVVPILRADHALRGVEVPAGQTNIEFYYEPASLIWGIRLSAVGLALALVWPRVRRT